MIPESVFEVAGSGLLIELKNTQIMNKQIPNIAYNSIGFFFNMAVKYKYSPWTKGKIHQQG
jgi:hypothetical protein